MTRHRLRWAQCTRIALWSPQSERDRREMNDACVASQSISKSINFCANKSETNSEAIVYGGFFYLYVMWVLGFKK